MFASRSMAEHLVRGIAGVAAIVLATRLGSWWALPLVAFALWTFRGCPMCWTIGLFETLAQAVHVRTDISAKPTCPDCR